ncbi:MAG: NAD+ synthase [Methylophaga sp.]|uniref:NAD+ synthase n=1 Tax=Methylophaga sp. UBA678 TaxID=1946901 RepID=UPI000C4C5B4B|nr:NAD+ synthase [Methylophaga sp. UBA678]MAX53369.1 NAD+ synthase [Methylophaga sp.]|tara:strand:- start:57067 stop:58707 length:1641 start_codon:yes stop_codon:yes gene_type:complete
MQTLTLVMGQINPVVGDVAGNVNRIIESANQAKQQHNADLVVFPELTLSGYPPEDLLLRPGLLKRVRKALSTLASKLDNIAVLVGHPAGDVESGLYNSASLIDDGKVVCTYHKQQLPNYGVFDEKRYFVEGDEAVVFDFRGINIGITICEDIWFKDPAARAKAAGAELIVNLNASPYHVGKWPLREAEVNKRVSETGLPVIYVNQYGGQDELVFDGYSFVINAAGTKVAQAPALEFGLFPVSIKRDASGTLSLSGTLCEPEEELSTIFKALTLGLKDYIEKNHFPGVVLGLSGGIDSALTMALAVDAIGADKVHAVMMPSRYTSQMSLDDAKLMAEGLGVKYSIISIEPTFNAFIDSLADEFKGLPNDTTEENIQARCRGIILMALSNKTGSMVLSTGNKSEMAVGYSTLYGDMAGGYSPLKDVYKTLVYQLSRHRNQQSPAIPERIITRPPSAELAEGQLDQDSLPDYAVLDQILQRYIADQQCFEDLVEGGYDADVVARVIKMVDRNEYKRRQAPPGIRISSRAFGRDRRYPITSGYTVTSTIE